jgi:hypothetical protein
MKPGDLVVIKATGTVATMAQNGKFGLVTNVWEAPSYLGGDIFVDILVEGVVMNFHRDEIQDLEDVEESL